MPPMHYVIRYTNGATAHPYTWAELLARLSWLRKIDCLVLVSRVGEVGRW